MRTITAYCFLHADSPNPIQDLVNQGLVNSTWLTWTCGQIKNQLQIEEDNQARRNLDFTQDCWAGNMAPSGWWKCWDAGKEVGLNAGECDYNRPSDPLTAAEYAECDARDKQYGEGKYADTNDDKDKDTKESDK